MREVGGESCGYAADSGGEEMGDGEMFSRGRWCRYLES